MTKDGAPRRFYQAVGVAELGEGFAVTLDGRRLKTPAKAHFIVPTGALAEACAGEWGAQDGAIRPEKMPLTRLSNVALDHAPAARAALAGQIVNFARTDLICHRAERPEPLVARHGAVWDPLLAWSAEALAAPLVAAPSLLALVQPQASLDAIAARAAALDDFRLTGLAHAAGLAGSAVIALALLMGRLSGQGAFEAAALDDLFQLETWGEDGEARQRLSNQQAEFLALERFFTALGQAC